jgi:DNA-binding transcriptional ArsR family regulator
MVTFTFTVEDLARTRFAISPMWELVSGKGLLRDPSLASLHLPWVEEVRPAAREVDSMALLALIAPRGYMPDFLTPPPSSPLATFAEELELVRSTPTPQVRREMGFFLGARKPPEALRRFLDQPRRALAELGDTLNQLWERTLEPHWPRLRALLEADVLYRSRRLTDGGPAGLFADLHPNVSFGEARLEVQAACSADEVALGGRGLLLVPSAFAWQNPRLIIDPPWQPTLIYPARGVALLWEPGSARTSEALAGVLGQTRATLLEALDAPVSTTDLAHRLELSPGGVSQALTALRDAGLITGARRGRRVHYLRTPTGDKLVEATQP